MADQTHISLPLQTLFDMLRTAGISLSPDQVVRVEQVLWRLGKSYQHDLEGLKTVLAPLICQSPKEQEQFYELFDQWLNIHVVPPPPPPPPTEPEVIKEARRSWQRPLILLGALAGLSLLIWALWPTPEPQKPAAFFELEAACIPVGQPFSPLNIAADSTLKQIWDFGDGTVDSVAPQPTHQYAQPGEYAISLTVYRGELDSTFRKQVYVHQLAKPVAAIEQTQLEESYTFSPDTTAPGWQYEWKIGNETVSTDSILTRQLADRERHYVELIVSLEQDEQGVCTDRTTEVVDLRLELVELPDLEPLRADHSATTYLWNSKAYVTWILLTLLLIAAVVLGRRFWTTYKRRPPETEAFTSIFHPVSGPPIFLPFPTQNHLISGGNRLRQLAEALRQREHSERKFIDLPATLTATVQSAGMPDIRFYQQERPIQYLALVETKGSQDQQSRLFQEYLAILKHEQVPVEIWYYQEDPLICFQHDSEQEVPLSRLAQVFGDHRLIIFGEGETLLHPTRKTLLPEVAEQLDRWPNKALLSPKPVLQWNYKEQILLDHLIVLPADLQGQADLLASWDDRDPLSFRELKRALLQQRASEEPWLLSDVTDVDELKETLGPSRFAWLAAAALYPRPVWELTLAMGSLFPDREEGKEPLKIGRKEVSYDDLLMLTRMPWLQDGDLPEALRGQLLDSLTEEEEQEARRLLVELLELVEVPENSFAAQEQKVQLAVNQALLRPEDERHQAGLELLLREGLLDPAVRKQVKETRAAAKQSKRPLWGILLLLTLLSTVLGFWQSNQQPEQAYLGLATQEVDSAAYYLNLSADALLEQNREDFNQAIAGLDRWISTEKYSGYQNALYDYLSGKEAYVTRNWKQARDNFVNAQVFLSADSSQTEIADASRIASLGSQVDSLVEEKSSALWLHALHAEGLSWYFEGELDSARMILELLSPSDLLQVGSPNLQTLLGESPQNDSSALDLAETLLSLVQDAMVAGNSPEDRIKAYTWLHQVYQLMLAPSMQTSDPDRYLSLHTRKELLMTGLLNGLYFSGSVNDETGNSLPGVAVSYFDGNVTTDSYGQFRMEVQPEDIWEESIAFLLLRDGFQRKDTTIRIVDLLPMQPFRLEMTDPTQQTTAVADVTDLYASLDEALKMKDCDLLDSLMEVLLEANAVSWNFYREKQVELCGTPAISPPEMLPVPAGSFMMGSEENDAEKPVHQVAVSGFFMSRYEITNEQYAAFLNAKDNQEEGGTTWYYESGTGYNGYAEAAISQNAEGTWQVKAGRENHPVNYVSWYGARAYCVWLSEKTGDTYRLPSEAEWEYAAGGGTAGRDSLGYRLHEYAGSDNVDEVAWYTGNTNDTGTREVGTKRANELGLYDMSGNVWEWCADTWHENYVGAPETARAWTSGGNDSRRVLRGGSWNGNANDCRVASRDRIYPNGRSNDDGFRVVRYP